MSGVRSLTQKCAQLVTRLTAVRGALQDHLQDHPLVFEGVAAVLHFVSQICKKLKTTILGEGSGPLQVLLVQVCCPSSPRTDLVVAAALLDGVGVLGKPVLAMILCCQEGIAWKPIETATPCRRWALACMRSTLQSTSRKRVLKARSSK